MNMTDYKLFYQTTSSNYDISRQIQNNLEDDAVLQIS